MRIVAQTSGETGHRNAYLKCPKCKLPSVAILSVADEHQVQQEVDYITNGDQHYYYVLRDDGDPTDQGWKVESIFPKPPAPQIPDHLPPAVQKALASAERAFQQDGDEETAAGAYGRALDLATKLIAEMENDAARYAGKKLNDRIDMLVKARRLTPELGEWAHHIKAVRNGAMHEIAEIDREELSALRGLTEMVLRYLFTLPGMLAERKAAAAAGLTAPPEAPIS